MAEYIDRDRAVAFVEAMPSKADALNVLRELKAADVEQVVRCKDCKFYYRMTAETGICELACRHLGNDGFCSEGERKDGDHAEGTIQKERS